MRRTNRNRHPESWRRQTAPRILEDEKLVAFRMSARRYAVLKRIAGKQLKAVATLINEVLDNKFHLEEKAQQLFKDEGAGRAS